MKSKSNNYYKVVYQKQVKRQKKLELIRKNKRLKKKLQKKRKKLKKARQKDNQELIIKIFQIMNEDFQLVIHKFKKMIFTVKLK